MKPTVTTVTAAQLKHPRGRTQAAQRFSTDGALALGGLYAPAVLEAAHHAFVVRYGGLDESELAAVGSRVGHERYMISVEWAPPFDDPALWTPEPLNRLLAGLLGSTYVLSSYALVVAYPGATDQHVHMDHPLLFEGAVLSRALPPYAVTVAVPLIDLNAKTGGTRVWLGSHRRRPRVVGRRSDGQVLLPSRGDGYVMDYRLLHGGTANPGPLARPVLYIAYSRPWFRDAANFSDHPPVRITADARAALPPRLRARLPAG